MIFGCRELLLTADDPRARAGTLADGSARSSRGQWERLADGEVFDGMEAWLPWLADDETLLTDLLADSAQVVLIEPRRLRDRAVEVLRGGGRADRDARRPPGASGWPATRTLPRLHVAFDRLLAEYRRVRAVGAPGRRGARRPGGRRPGHRHRWPGTRPGWPSS